MEKVGSMRTVEAMQIHVHMMYDDKSMSIGKQSQNPDILGNLEILARICVFSLLAHTTLNFMAPRYNLESKYSQF